MGLIKRISNIFQSEQKLSLIKGALGSFSLKISSTGMNFLSAILMARLLGPGDYGIYSYAMAIIFFMSVPTSLGLPSLLVRYIASYFAKEEWGYIRGLMVTSNKIVLVLSVTIVSTAWFVTEVFKDNFKPMQLYTLQAALFLLPLSSVSGLRSAVLQGLNRTIIGQFPETLLKSAVILGLLYAALLFLPRNLITPVFVMHIQIVATAVAFVFGSIFLWKFIPKNVKKTSANYEYKKWLRSALPFMLFGGMIVINQKTDLLMLGWLSGTYAVGIYEVATRGAEIFIFILVSINVAAGPTMTNLYVKGETQRLKNLVASCTGVIFIISFFLFLVIYFWGELLIGVLFGAKYSEAYNPLVILCTGQLFNALLGTVVGQLLIMTGHERETTIGIGFGALMNLVLCFYLIPELKAVGAAFASAASLTSGNLLLVFYAIKKLGINTTIFALLFHRRKLHKI
ncbi:flippase [Methylomonas rosea]|uniref:Flippase n=1 Tax=Methylomonas rosea TaxID=2952227 RepID=A0ABT1TZ79_9GAMM|nr:flippase [Methylomonas sp. WSC-7]MCQ8119701.1 flippase [Methylomonas sp. WSC-7]